MIFRISQRAMTTKISINLLFIIIEQSEWESQSCVIEWMSFVNPITHLFSSLLTQTHFQINISTFFFLPNDNKLHAFVRRTQKTTPLKMCVMTWRTRAKGTDNFVIKDVFSPLVMFAFSIFSEWKPAVVSELF